MITEVAGVLRQRPPTPVPGQVRSHEQVDLVNHGGSIRQSGAGEEEPTGV